MKEETLEEAAKNKYPIENTGAMFMPNRHEVSNIFRQEGFIEGANWQAERMYSEEEVIAIVEKSRATGLTAEYLIEQSKKK